MINLFIIIYLLSIIFCSFFLLSLDYPDFKYLFDDIKDFEIYKMMLLISSFIPIINTGLSLIVIYIKFFK